jgi:putative oxidoreductase
MKDLALFLIRITLGALLAGHGSQKLFGWFGGPGLKNWHGFTENMGMKPGRVWGSMAAVSEFGGGVLTALGFLNPAGPIAISGVMTVAIRKAHWGKPIWAQQGGAELPLTNLATATALTLVGPGKLSLDNLFGIRIPRWLAVLMYLGGLATTVTVLYRPEVAQDLLDQFERNVPAGSRSETRSSSVPPDLEVETRPRVQEPTQPTPTV